MSSQQEQGQGRPVRELEWVADGTRRLLANLVALSDADLDAPTALPGWGRREVLSHIANNADALRNLLHWARTGEERRMYASPRQRDADIVAVAALPAGELREKVVGTAAALAADLDGLPERAWSAMIITAQGLSRKASEIPWMRCREVYVHTVDLGAGTVFADLPVPFLAALVDDIADRRSHLANGPALALTAIETGGRWTVAGDGPQVPVEAPLATLAGWLAGRPVTGLADTGLADTVLTDTEGAPVPELPAWL